MNAKDARTIDKLERLAASTPYAGEKASCEARIRQIRNRVDGAHFFNSVTGKPLGPRG